MIERKITISHTTWMRCTNGYRHPDDLLAGIADDMAGLGDITATIDMGGGRTECYVYSVDDDEWTTTEPPCTIDLSVAKLAMHQLNNGNVDDAKTTLTAAIMVACGFMQNINDCAPEADYE